MMQLTDKQTLLFDDGMPIALPNARIISNETDYTRFRESPIERLWRHYQDGLQVDLTPGRTTPATLEDLFLNYRVNDLSLRQVKLTSFPPLPLADTDVMPGTPSLASYDVGSQRKESDQTFVFSNRDLEDQFLNILGMFTTFVDGYTIDPNSTLAVSRRAKEPRARYNPRYMTFEARLDVLVTNLEPLVHQTRYQQTIRAEAEDQGITRAAPSTFDIVRGIAAQAYARLPFRSAGAADPRAS